MLNSRQIEILINISTDLSKAMLLAAFAVPALASTVSLLAMVKTLLTGFVFAVLALRFAKLKEGVL